MKNETKSFLWIFPQKNLKNSGIYQYNQNLFFLIKKNFKIYKFHRFYSNNYTAKFILNSLIFPIYIILQCKSKNISRVLIPEENIVFYSFLFKIFNINSYAIIHDLRDFDKIKTNNLKEIIKILYLKFNYSFLKFINKIIVPSKFVKKRVLKKYNKKIIIVPNLFVKTNKKILLNKNKFYSKYKIENKKKILLMITSTDSYKNNSTILNCLKKLENKFLLLWIYKINFINEFNKNKSLIIKNNLNCKMFKNISYYDTKNFLKNCDIFLSPSIFEGFGRPNIEALEFNKRIICSDIEINREILGKNALYVKKIFNDEEWCKIIKKSMQLRERKNNIFNKYCINEFNFKIVNDNFKKLFT